MRTVAAQNTDGQVVGLVALADPTDPGFERLVSAFDATTLVTSVRVRLVPGFQPGSSTTTADPGDRLVDGLALLAEQGLVATIETGASELARVAELARRFPRLSVVLDHFGWPEDLSEPGLRDHLALLRPVADEPNVTTRIDAIGTIFRDWDTDTLRPWLHGVVQAFGPERCMLGSDLPIETLHASFTDLYTAYDTIFAAFSDDDRHLLFSDTTRRALRRRHPGLNQVQSNRRGRHPTRSRATASTTSSTTAANSHRAVLLIDHGCPSSPTPRCGGSPRRASPPVRRW